MNPVEKYKEKARVLLFLNQEKLLSRELYEFEINLLNKIHYHNGDLTSKDIESLNKESIETIFQSFDTSQDVPNPIQVPYDRFCFCCKKRMEPILQPDYGDTKNAVQLTPPIDGTFWDCYGNYGSRIWDPVNERRRLNIIICDNCLVENSKYVINVDSYSKNISQVSEWRVDG